MPSHAELTEAVGRTFTFANASVAAIEARLTAAPLETPMDDEFDCYSAHFELPVGLRLPQDTYRVSAPSGVAWDLFATPVRPAANGAGAMCIVIHCIKADDAARHDASHPGPA